MSKKKQHHLKKVNTAPSSKQKQSIWTRDTLLPLIGIIILTLLAFVPVFDAEFVNWDDDKNFSDNPLITTLNKENFWSNIREIFVTPVIGNYNPLPIFTFAIEQHVFGLDQPLYWHLNNLLLHIGCVIAVYMIGIRLKLSTLATILLAGLFAVHPMRVESVAWVTERKDVLFGIFYLWGMYLYLKNLQEGSSVLRTVVILILFTLSLFSKIQAVIFPVSLVLLDYLHTGKFTLKQFLSKWYLFAGSLAFGILGIYLLGEQGSLESTTEYLDFQRVFIGSYSYLIYLVKSIVPFRLSPLYPYPQSFPVGFYPSILVFFAAAGLLITSYLKGWKHLFFGIAFFSANIFFLLQIKGAGQGFLADRFTYIAYIGLFYLMAYGYDEYLTRLSNPLKYTVVVAPLLVYSVMTFQQCKIWKNSGTLWTHVTKYYTNTTLPYGNRANYYRDIGESDKALQDYARAIALKPNEAGPYNSRARLYFDSGKQSDLSLALNEYNLAIARADTIAEYFTNRGATYARMGDFDNALIDLNAAVELDPSFLNSYLNRSVIHNQLGNTQMAIDDLEAYVKQSPYKAGLWYELGRLYSSLNNYQKAHDRLTRAIQLNNREGSYYVERAKAQYSLNKKTQAENDLNMATQLGAKIPPKVSQIILGK